MMDGKIFWLYFIPVRPDHCEELPFVNPPGLTRVLISTIQEIVSTLCWKIRSP